MNLPAKTLEQSDSPHKPKRVSLGLHIDKHELGKADTFRYNVSTHVVDEKYDLAITALRDYLELDSEFPQFKDRITRHIEHSIDLINAIRVKRNFPGAASLTMAKQQELNERFRQHFDELQATLKQIEKIRTDLRVQDVRSTVLVLKTLVNSVFLIVIAAFITEAGGGLFSTTVSVLDDYFISLVDWIFKVLKM
jgi:hypothetical protein